MAELTISIPPSLKNWIDARIAQGLYTDAADYVRDLLRRDQEQVANDSSWLRTQIQEGLASGTVDAEPEDVLDAIIAEDPDLRG
jgi:antitoxin ParD1/3/4